MSSKFRAAHKLSALSPENKVNQSRVIVADIKSSTYLDITKFPIPITAVETAIQNLDDAIKLAASGAPGTVSAMHEKERVLINIFNLLKSYIEMVANDTTDPKSVIESAGLTAVSGGGTTAVTALTLTAKGNGTIEVSVPRGKGEAAFVYQYSSDGDTTWQDFEISKLATVQLKGQTPASVLFFRYAAVSKSKGAFSQPLSVIVL